MSHSSSTRDAGYNKSKVSKGNHDDVQVKNGVGVTVQEKEDKL